MLCEKLQRHFSSASKQHPHQHTVAAINSTTTTAAAVAATTATAHAATAATSASTPAAGAITAAGAGAAAAAAAGDTTTAAGIAVHDKVKPAELALLLDQSDLSDEPAYLAQTPTPKGDSQATSHR
jgi:hypothetical protein